MSENISKDALFPFDSLIDISFGKCATFYSYIILTPIDGETLVTPIFYLNGSEATVLIEIKWESEMIKVRLVTEYELFYVKPYITKVTISQDGKRNIENFIFNRKDMDEESWMEFKRPKFDNPKFIKFLFGFIYDEAERKINRSMSYKMELCERLSRLYTDKTYADFKIRVGTVEFLTHKAILAVKSPVFADMFNKNTEGKCENVLIVNDTDPKSFEIFLKYLYLCEINNIPQNDSKLILNLIKISIIYKVDDFKLEMSKLAICSLTPENIHQWLKIAIALDLQYIKTVIISCIRNCINSGVPKFVKSSDENIL